MSKLQRLIDAAIKADEAVKKELLTVLPAGTRVNFRISSRQICPSTGTVTGAFSTHSGGSFDPRGYYLVKHDQSKSWRTEYRKVHHTDILGVICDLLQKP